MANRAMPVVPAPSSTKPRRRRALGTASAEINIGVANEVGRITTSLHDGAHGSDVRLIARFFGIPCGDYGRFAYLPPLTMLERIGAAALTRANRRNWAESSGAS